MKKRKIPVIEAEGSNYDAGFQIGQVCKSHISNLIKTSKEKYPRLTGKNFEYFVHLGRKILDISKARYPNYIKEIRGMADGANVDFEEYFALNFEDAVLDVAEKCTSIFLRTSGVVLLGHNEDWTSDYINELFILKFKQPKGTYFLALSYLSPPNFISVCLNSSGIAFSGNSMYTKHKLGIPQSFILRSMADAKNSKEIIKNWEATPRSMGYNSIIVSRDRIIDLEASREKSALINVRGDYFVHTNHPLKLKGDCYKNSLLRFNRASELVKNSEDRGVELLKKILTDHKDRPDSICRHSKRKEKIKWQTVASSIIDVSNGRVLIAHGNPCTSKFKEYEL